MLRYASLGAPSVRSVRSTSSALRQSGLCCLSTSSNSNRPVPGTKQAASPDSDLATIFREHLEKSRQERNEQLTTKEQPRNKPDQDKQLADFFAKKLQYAGNRNNGQQRRTQRFNGAPQQRNGNMNDRQANNGRFTPNATRGASPMRNGNSATTSIRDRWNTATNAVASPPPRPQSSKETSSFKDMLKNMAKPSTLATSQPPNRPRVGSNTAPGSNRIRDMLKGSTAADSSPPRGMAKEVSSLREAFLASIAKSKEVSARKLEEERKQHERRVDPAKVSQPAWRRNGAQGFRKRLNQEQREQREQEEQERKTRAAVNRSSGAFYMTRADYDDEKRERAKEKARNDDKQVTLPPREATVTELSALFRAKIDKLMSMLRGMGERPTSDDHVVDLDVMELLAMELGLEPVRSSRRRSKLDDDKNLLLQRRAVADAAGGQDEDSAAKVEAYEALPPRPPVVCIMGHVDHGKTTLMDALRQRSQGASKTKASKSKSKKGKQSQSEEGAVAGTEAGGITQVISAFQVPLENQDSAITFLDTPGHAAFRAMRESGSNAADVIVLVVAADDGVSPQTVEILNFYKSIIEGAGNGGISMVVAMTKIDKHGIDISESRHRIENQLLEHGILSESFASSGESEYGPPVQLIPVSGLTGEGIDDLIEGLVLQSEMMDLRADENAQAEGIVMDARMDKGIGVVADCIVRWGSLERGDVVVSGVHSGKVKALKDVNGVTIKKGSPSQPVRIFGFKSLPKAGDPIICVASEEVADQIVERRQALLGADQSSRTSTTEAAEMQVTGAASKRGTSLEAARSKYGRGSDAPIENEGQIRIPIIIRADGEGSLAALQEAVLGVGKSSSMDLVIDTVSAGIGAITASDVRMAKESGASVLSFGVKQNDKAALAMAEAEGVDIRSNDVIYSLLDDAKELFAAHLPAVPIEVVHGKAKVLAIFDVNNKKNAERIAGLSVLDGTLFKGKAKDSKGAPLPCHYRVLRKGGRGAPEGDKLQVSSLRKVKEDVDNVRRGEECGLGLLDYDDYQEGDIIECYSVEMKREFV